MSNLRESLSYLASKAASIRQEATLRQYFIQALDEFVKEAHLFSIDPGPLFQLEEPIIRGRSDARLGGLTFEVKLPKPNGKGVEAAIKQVAGYIDEYKEQLIHVRGVAYDGEFIALLDEQKAVVFRGEASDGATLLAAWLMLLAPPAKTPEEMVDRFGSASALSQNTIKSLYDLFAKFESQIPFVQEVFTIWQAVYGCAANVNKETIKGLRRTAKSLGITIKTKKDAEKFVFALETYLSILLKLLVARVAVEQKLVSQDSVSGILCEPQGTEHIRYANLSSFIPHLANVFEEDPFDWFIDAAKRELRAEVTVRDLLRCIVETIDNVHLVEMGQDFLQIFYQHFFDAPSRRALGEFYTNIDLVRETLDAVGYDGSANKPIIDFCCGSATFLVEILRRIKVKGKSRKPSLLLADIERNVFGVDIHPLAVAMARVNVIIAVAPLLQRGQQFRVPVYWADSLVRLSAKQKSRKLGTLGEPVRISVPGMRTFNLPDPEAFDWERLFEFCRQHISTVAGKASFEPVWRRFEEQYAPEDILPFEDALRDFIRQLVERQNEGRDTRWLPMLRNILFVEKQRGKFQFVIGNPPWVRIHNIDEELRKRINEDYNYCAKAGWKRGCDLAGIGRGFARQTDLCVPFVERAIEMLAPGGYLSFVITAKVQQALYANQLRRDLVTERTIVRLSDYSLYPLPLFENAVNYPLVLSVRNQKPEADSVCQVEVTNSEKQKLHFEVPQKQLSLLSDDPESPWFMAPSDVVSAFRRMQSTGGLLGDDAAVRPRMGIKTSANDIFLLSGVESTDSETEVMVTTDGGDTIRIESSLVRPLIRGRDIRAWGYSIRHGILWTHDDLTAKPLSTLPRRAGLYFANERIKNKLENRQDYKDTFPYWCVFRAGPEKLGPKVCWKELANEMQATAMRKDGCLPPIDTATLIPLHTAYLIPVTTHRAALLLAAVFNSTYFRAFVMSFAPRARGGYFRHFSWTVGLTPVPLAVVPPNPNHIITSKPPDRQHEADMVKWATKLHGDLTEADRHSTESDLDRTISKLYGLSSKEKEKLTAYYEFMRPTQEVADLFEQDDNEEEEE